MGVLDVQRGLKGVVTSCLGILEGHVFGKARYLGRVILWVVGK